jgi:hypothetical protein
LRWRMLLVTTSCLAFLSCIQLLVVNEILKKLPSTVRNKGRFPPSSFKYVSYRGMSEGESKSHDRYLPYPKHVTHPPPPNHTPRSSGGSLAIVGLSRGARVPTRGSDDVDRLIRLALSASGKGACNAG